MLFLNSKVIPVVIADCLLLNFDDKKNFYRQLKLHTVSIQYESALNKDDDGGQVVCKDDTDEQVVRNDNIARFNRNEDGSRFCASENYDVRGLYYNEQSFTCNPCLNEQETWRDDLEENSLRITLV